MPDRPLTVLLAAESAYGPTNNCIGIGAELTKMGHRVVFAAEESWAGKIEPLGIEERLVSMAPPPEEEAAAEHHLLVTAETCSLCHAIQADRDRGSGTPFAA